jgi:hypothetical protein
MLKTVLRKTRTQPKGKGRGRKLCIKSIHLFLFEDEGEAVLGAIIYLDVLLIACCFGSLLSFSLVSKFVVDKTYCQSTQCI